MYPFQGPGNVIRYCLNVLVIMYQVVLKNLKGKYKTIRIIKSIKVYFAEEQDFNIANLITE